MHTGFWWGDQRERDHFEDLSVDGRIILKWIFKKLDWRGMEWIDLAQDTDGSCECCNEASGSIKCGEFLD